MFFAAVRNRLARVLLAALLIAAVGMPPWAPLFRPANAAGVPESPRVSLDTTYALPTGPTITVPAGGDFQAALNSAQPGSVIVLQAGATYAGNFSLPNKTGAGWIYIQSSALTSLPAPGTRVTPAQAALMPKLIDTSGLHNGSAPGYPTIQTQPNAHHYRLVGLEITTNWTTGSLNATDYALVNLDCPWTCSALSQVPTNIVIDRSYIHGTPTGNIRNGLILNSASTAIVDSWISDIHEISNQSHAIIAFDGPGPFKIVNNELQAAGLSIYFSDQARLTVPADIEVRGNHLFKPLSWWHPGDPNAGLTTWSVKNSFELKNAARVLVDGNVFEHAWHDYFQTNSGAGITLTPRAGNCGCSWHLVQDVTITHNIITNTTMGTSNLGTDNNGTTLPLQRALLRDNLYLNIGAIPDGAWGNQGRFLYSSTPSGTGFIDVTFDHITLLNSSLSNMYTFGGGSANFQGLVFTNNITTSGGGLNDNTLNTLNASYPGYLFTKNAMVGGTDNPYPTGNFFPSSYNPGVGFANYAGADYHLAASSPYKNAGTDGRDLGADIDAVLAATATAISGIGGTPGLSVSPPTTVDFGSVLVSAVTLSGAALTWTTNEPADSQVEYGLTTSYGSATTVNASLVTAHVVTFSGLATGTTYHYRVKSKDAAGNLAMSGDFTFATLAPDTTPPTVPTGLTATAVSVSGVNLAWSPSTDDVGIAGYNLFRNGAQIGTVSTTSYQDTGLSSATTYTYAVAAYDAAGNGSAQTSPVSATTLVPVPQSPYTGVAFAVPGQIEAEDFDNGGESVVYHDLTPGNQGGAYRTDVDVDIRPSAAGNYEVFNFQTGEWLEYTINVTQARTYRLELLLSNQAYSPTPGCHADIGGQPVTGSVSVPNTGLWSTYWWVGANGIALTTGPHILRITADQQYFGFAALRLVVQDTTPPTASITAPTAGTTVAGTVTVAATAADNVGVVGVQFKLNEVNLGPEDTTNTYSISWDTTTVGNGSYTLTAVARDAAGNAATSAGITVTVNNDLTQPDLSCVTASATGPASATITWTTDEPADSQVEYGLTTGYGSASALDAGKVTAHTVSLTGLAAGSLYHYRVKSKDAAGNLAVSSDAVFTTAPAPDTTPPTVVITAPAANSSVSGTVTVTASASDNIGVASIQFKLDDANLGAEITTPPYTFTWNTTTVANGTHTLTAVARDVAGHIATSAPESVTAANGDTLPPSTPTSLTATAVSSSQIFLVWSPSTDNVGVVGYKIFRDGVQVATNSNSTYQDAGLSRATLYTYTVAAFDAAGNTSAPSAPATATTQAAQMRFTEAQGVPQPTSSASAP